VRPGLFLLTFRSCSAKIRTVWRRVKGAREKELNAFLYPSPTTPSYHGPQILVAAARRIAEASTNEWHLFPQQMRGPRYKGCLRSPSKHSRQGTLLFSRSLIYECAPDTPAFRSSSSACCRNPDIRSPTNINPSLPTEGETSTDFAGLHHRNEAFASVDRSPWLNPVQPEYSLHPIMAHVIMAPPHVNQGQPHPSARYSYSLPSDLSYSREADQQPRLGINTHSYHTSEDTVHESQNLQHQYYLPNGHYQRFQFQPNDLPAYSDLHVGLEHNDK